MGYDNKFKKRAIEYREEGNTIRQTAKVFGISPNTLNTWIQEYRKNGEFIRKERVYNYKVDDERLLKYVDENPDSYQKEIAEKMGCNQSTISRSLKRLKITQKKIKRFKEQDSEKVLAYLSAIDGIAKEKLVYIDETGIDTFLYREYAYAPRGRKVIGRISGKKYKRVSIVAAQLAKEIIAPLQYSGTMDSQLFEYWFENCLIPKLPPSSTIIMDNASFHRKSKLFCLAQNYGHHIIFLPPYSPELNPIENFWAWLKKFLVKILPFYNNFDDALCYCFNSI